MPDPKSNKAAHGNLTRILRLAGDITDAEEEITADATDLATCMALANSLKTNYNLASYGYLNELLALLRTIPR